MASQTLKAPHRLRILIVGGSIAGIACAYTLAKAGHEIVVFERSDGTRRCPSVARCPPHMARILKSWGVPLEKIAEMGGRTDKAVFKHAMTDETLNLVQFRGPALDDLGAPFLFLPHGDLHTILLDLAKAQGAQIRYSAEVAHVDPQRPSVHLASGEAWLGDLIIGADGYDSIVRRVVTGEELKLDAPQRASINMHISTEKVQSDPELARLIPQDEWQVWMSDNRCLEAGFVHSQSYYYLLLACPIQPGWDFSKRWDASVSLADLNLDLSMFKPTIQRLIGLAERATPIPYASHSSAEDLVHEDGKVLLVGDAGFQYPAPGIYGPSIAIEDAEVLGTLLGRARGQGQVHALLGAFEELRPPRAANVAARDLEVLDAWSTIPVGPGETATADGLDADAVLASQWEEFFRICGYNAFQVALYNAHEAAEEWLAQWPGLLEREDSLVDSANNGMMYHKEVTSHMMD